MVQDSEDRTRMIALSGQPTAMAKRTIEFMADYKFKDGDVVSLKSGGPEMTIEGIGKYGLTNDGDDAAKCVWLDKTETRKEGIFSLPLLKLAEPQQPPGTRKLERA